VRAKTGQVLFGCEESSQCRSGDEVAADRMREIGRFNMPTGDIASTANTGIVTRPLFVRVPRVAVIPRRRRVGGRVSMRRIPAGWWRRRRNTGRVGAGRKTDQ
jgi:hypothetical protein